MSQAHEALSADHEKLQSDADQAVEAAAAIERDLEAQRALAADLKVWPLGLFPLDCFSL